MPRTVDEGFRDFLRKLTPSSSESEAAKNHRKSIRQCIENNHGLNRFWRTGSFGNGTSVSGYSDVDYMASLPPTAVTPSSDHTLNNVRNSLARRFPDTNVRKDCPAITVPFGTKAKETTEVTPAKYLRLSNGFKVYGIPNCNGGWMTSSPDAHNHFVDSLNQRLGKKLEPLIRFAKAWKYYNSVPISSFYLELRIAKYAESENAIIYSLDLKRIFEKLEANDLHSVQDPMKISGLVGACQTQAQLNEARRKVSRAAGRARKGRRAENDGDTKDAFYWWNQFFNGRFPSYHYR
jgi:hypothetical protein